VRILLVKLPEPERPGQRKTFMPPFGLWSIAHNLRRWTGAEVEVTDCHLAGRLGGLPFLLERGWDVVGLSAQFSIQHDAYLAAAALAVASGARVVAGGFHAAAVPPPPGVEIVKGDGETGFAALLGVTKLFEDVEYPPVDAERMAPYLAAGAPHDLQSATGAWHPVEFSRGCFRRCGYCGVPRYWGAPRYYSREKITAHLADLVNAGIREVFIEDDNFLADANNFDWILDQLKATGLVWSTPNGIPARALASFVGRLAESGCWRVSLPFETGHDRGAYLMGLGSKWLPQPEALALVKAIAAQGIKTCGFFIIGYPGENLAEMQGTLDYANSLPLDQRNVYLAAPYPGTPLYDLCQAEGYLTSQPPALYHDLLYTRGLIQTPDFTPAEVEALRAADREKALARKDAKEA
jgi:radical SAM superfamily enzyme YgiQ (UPF0313 family)